MLSYGSGMTISSEQWIDQKKKRTPGVEAHRRETWLHILLPFLGGILLVAVLLIMALLLPQRAQVSLVADWMLTIFVLCPLALCLLPIYLLMMVAAFGMNKVHDKAASPLKRLEILSRTLAEKTISASESLSRASISLGTRFAFLDHIWEKSPSEESHEPTYEK
jgi:hypothetical protein